MYRLEDNIKADLNVGLESCGSGSGEVKGCCENCNDNSGCTKCGTLYLAERLVAPLGGLCSLELQYEGRFTPCTISVMNKELGVWLC